jgi:hypothetical protein
MESKRIIGCRALVHAQPLIPSRVVKKGSVVSFLRVLTKRGGDDEKTGGVSTEIRGGFFSAAPTKLQPNYRNAQQESIFHHPARVREVSAITTDKSPDILLIHDATVEPNLSGLSR